MKGSALFQGETIKKKQKYIDKIQNYSANFNQTWHNVFLGEVDSILFNRRAPQVSNGGRNEKTKHIHDT